MEQKKNTKVLTTLLSVAIGLLLLPALLLYTAGGLYRSFFALAGTLVETAGAITVPSFAGLPDSDPVTFLLFGIDSGEWVKGTYRPGTGRADTIVLIQADPLTKKASMLSIPRDTLVVIPGRPGDDKINHSYAFGKTDLLVETVELFTGLSIDHYVGLNYLAFKDVVDLLGGVEFDVDRVINCRGLRLEPGIQHLDGDEAFALVSFRKEAMGDIGRVRRQQRFIKTIAGAARQRPLDDLFYIMLAAWDNIDTDISMPEALALSRKLKGITEEDMAMGIVPGWFYSRNGISYWKSYPGETEQMIRSLFHNVVGADTPEFVGAGFHPRPARLG